MQERTQERIQGLEEQAASLQGQLSMKEQQLADKAQEVTDTQQQLAVVKEDRDALKVGAGWVLGQDCASVSLAVMGLMCGKWRFLDKLLGWIAQSVKLRSPTWHWLGRCRSCR